MAACPIADPAAHDAARFAGYRDKVAPRQSAATGDVALVEGHAG